MDRLERYRELVMTILREYVKIPFSHGNVQMVPVFDREGDHYLIMLVGWEGVRREHGCLVHIDIINGKFWIQRDGTEEGIGRKLLDAGVPKEHLVLGFRSPELRRHTEFAVE